MSSVAAKLYFLPLFKLGFLVYVLWMQLLGALGLVLKGFYLYVVIHGKIYDDVLCIGAFPVHFPVRLQVAVYL